MPRKLTARQVWYRTICLKLPHWKLLSFRTIRSRGSRCELCASSKRLQCHHLNYSRLHKEKDTDLQVLCSVCHKKKHKK